MRDLFGNDIIENSDPIKINIFADEVQEIECPYTKEKWIYIGIIVEKIDNPIREEIIAIRYNNNFDVNSPYFKKNDRIIHWREIDDIDTKNIAKRWIEFILDPSKSADKFYAYVLGINVSNLSLEKFDKENVFNSVYNRFFRTAILYAIKTFFPSKQIIIENIFHEEGQQKYHHYFPWHCIYKIEESEPNVKFKCNEITFLPKNHRENEGGDRRSNLIQLCDLFLGLCVGFLHGIGTGKKSEYKKELADLFQSLFVRMINNSENPHSRYQHKDRIMIRFFPRKKINSDDNDIRLLLNQFYTKRRIYYVERKSSQMGLFVVFL